MNKIVILQNSDTNESKGVNKLSKLEETIAKLKNIDQNLLEKTQFKLDNLTKPLGSLGRLEELAKQYVAITEKRNPVIKNKVIFTLAADHGVTEEKVSAYPKEVTAQMVYNILNNGAGINILAKHIGARLVIADFGVASDLKADSRLVVKKVNYGTANMKNGPAMTRDEAFKSVINGIELFEEEYIKGIDIIGIGEMGIGNTTASSAITAIFTGKDISQLTGRGTGINDKSLEVKINIIKQAIKTNQPDINDPIDVLAKVGGFEIGGLCGIILSAAANRIPIVVDGFISAAAALLAFQIQPKVKDYLIAGHCSVEKGHQVILDHISIKPLLNLDLRLGEGTGAALAISLVEAGVKILTQMATFESAGVSKRNNL